MFFFSINSRFGEILHLDYVKCRDGKDKIIRVDVECDKQK